MQDQQPRDDAHVCRKLQMTAKQAHGVTVLMSGVCAESRAQLQAEQQDKRQQVVRAEEAESSLASLQARSEQQAQELQQHLQELGAAQQALTKWQADCEAAQVCFMSPHLHLPPSRAA